MRLVNTTPVPAKLMTAQLFGATHRIGMVVAKATFHIGPRGTELDTQDPWPLLDEDRATELGIVPRDDLPRRDDSGLLQIERILKGIEGISFIYLDELDVVRHRLVKDIIRAYSAESAERREN